MLEEKKLAFLERVTNMMKRVSEGDRPTAIIVVRLRQFLKDKVDRFAYRKGSKSINDYVVKAIERQVDQDEQDEASENQGDAA